MNDALVYLDEESGEMVEPDNAGLTLAALHGYAEARIALDVARSAKKAYLDRLAETDPEFMWLITDERARELEIAAVEEALADVVSPDLRRRHMRPISLDIGCLRVTWGKPAECWTQRVKPEAIARRDPELARQLGVECKVGEPPAPRITVRPEKLQEVAA